MLKFKYKLQRFCILPRVKSQRMSKRIMLKYIAIAESLEAKIISDLSIELN